MIISASKNPKDPGQQAQCCQIEAQLPDRRPHERADENYGAATLLPRRPAEPPKSAEGGPMMPITDNAHLVGPPLNGEHYDATAAFDDRVRNCKRQAASPADDREWTLFNRSCGNHIAHASLASCPRRIAMVRGRDPERMKAMTPPINASPRLPAATSSTRSRNIPLPKNIVSYAFRSR